MIPYAHCFLKNGSCISRSNIRNFNRRSKSSVKLLTEFAGEQMFYLLRTGKKNLVHILLIAMIAAFMNQFAVYLSEPTGGKCRVLYDLYIIGGTDGCGIRCGY